MTLYILYQGGQFRKDPIVPYIQLFVQMLGHSTNSIISLHNSHYPRLLPVLNRPFHSFQQSFSETKLISEIPVPLLYLTPPFVYPRRRPSTPTTRISRRHGGFVDLKHVNRPYWGRMEIVSFVVQNFCSPWSKKTVMR